MPVFAGGAVAQELSFQPRVSLGYQAYSFDLSDDDDVFDFEGDYFLGGLGLTVQRGRFFVDLYGQTNLTEAEDDEDDVVFLDVLTDRESTANRNEFNATLGYAVTQAVSVFGGLKYANNDVENDFIDINNDRITVDFEMEYFGPFAGASYAIPVADVGAIAVSGSVAYLDGDVTFDVGLDVGDESSSASADVDGAAIGANLGAAWIGSLAPLSPNLAKFGYTAGLDYSYYQFEDDGDEAFTEETLRFKVDLKYNF